jgi:hypothetical protein
MCSGALTRRSLIKSSVAAGSLLAVPIGKTRANNSWATRLDGFTHLRNPGTIAGFPGSSPYGFTSFWVRYFGTTGWVFDTETSGNQTLANTGVYPGGHSLPNFLFSIGPGPNAPNFYGIGGGIAPSGAYGFDRPGIVPWTTFPMGSWLNFMMAWNTSGGLSFNGSTITQSGVVKVYVNNQPANVVVWYYPTNGQNFAYTPFSPALGGLPWQVGRTAAGEIPSLNADLCDLYICQGVNCMSAIDDPNFRDAFFDQDTGFGSRQGTDGSALSRYFNTDFRAQILLTGPAGSFPANWAAYGAVFGWPDLYTPPGQQGSFDVLGNGLTTSPDDPFNPGSPL